MPLVDNFHIQPEEEELFYKACKVNSGFYGVKIDKKDIEYRTRNFESLTQQSQFPDVASAWNTLSDYEKDQWDSAGYWAGKSGWDLFAEDMGYRIANEIQGIAEASLYHQFKVGKIQINAPASAIHLIQNYNHAFPISILAAINMFNNLTATGAGYYCDMIVTAHCEYIDWEGNPDWEDLPTYFDLSTGDRWEYQESLLDTEGTVTAVYIEIDIYNMRGSLYLDGMNLIAHSVDHADDFQFYDMQANWDPVSIPAGASRSSVYWRNSFYQ